MVREEGLLCAFVLHSVSDRILALQMFFFLSFFQEIPFSYFNQFTIVLSKQTFSPSPLKLF